MALDRTLRFFYDVPNQRLVRDFSSDPAPAGDGVLMQGMTYQTEHRFGSYDPVARRWQQMDPAAWDGFKLAFGKLDDRPTAGSWKVTAGVNTSAEIPWNATASQVTTALAGATPSAIVGWTVTTTATGIYTFTRTAPGATSLLSVNTAGLGPSSQADVYRLQTGSSTVAEIQEVELFANPAGYQNTWTALAAGTVNVEVLEAGATGKNAQQRITFSTQPVGGGYALKMPNGKVTGVLAYDALPGAIEAAIQQVTGYTTPGEVTVTGGAGEPLVFVFSGSLGGVAQPAMAVQSAALEWPKGYRGTLSLATAQAKALTRGRTAPVQVTMEALIIVGGEPQPLVQRTAQLKNGLINPTTQAAPVVEPLLTQSIADALYWHAAMTSGGGDGAADAGKSPIFGFDGSITASGFRAREAPGKAFDATSFDDGTGIMWNSIYGPASTTQGLSMLWNGTILFPNNTARAGTRASLSVPALQFAFGGGDPSPPPDDEPTIVINETEQVAKLFAEGGWRRFAAWGAAAPFVCIVKGSGALVAVPSGTHTQLTNWIDDYDPSGAHAAGLVTVPRTATYNICVNIECPDPAEAYPIQLNIAINGTNAKLLANHTRGTHIGGSANMRLTEGSVVSIRVFHTSGSSKDFSEFSNHGFSIVEQAAE